MTNKVQKIREGIERLKSQLIKGACSSQIAMETMCKEEAYNEVLAILDSTQEEPVSDDTMTIRKEWFEHCKKSWYNEGYIDGKHNRDSQFGEPVSEELEDAAEKYADNEECKDTLEELGIKCAFKAGAQWQMHKDVEKQ